MALTHLTPVAKAPCFVEDDATASLARRSLAEGLGTMLLMIAVAGSSSHAPASSLGPAVAVGGSLIGLILAFGAVSGGHLNPTITILQWLYRGRRLDCSIAYVCAQVVGAVAGSLISAVMYVAPLSRPSNALPPWSSVASEAVASFGLMMVVFCCTRSTSKLVGPFAVGLWLMAAIVSTPTGSIANPAVAIGLLATPGQTSILVVLLFIIAQIAGGALATRIVSVVYPDDNPSR
ncbi:aquaporin [Rhizobium sp. SIMBA_035]